MHSISPNREPRTSVRLFTVFQPALPSLKRSLYVCSSLQRLSGLAQHVGFGKLKNIFLIRSNHVTLCYALCNRLVNLFHYLAKTRSFLVTSRCTASVRSTRIVPRYIIRSISRHFWPVHQMPIGRSSRLITSSKRRYYKQRS